MALAPTSIRAQGATPAPRDHVQADVDFVQGMIVHHAQAVVMSDWAATHAASPALKLLASRIALSQRDEITMMQSWLRDRGLAVPDPLHTPDSAAMPGMHMTGHHMMMPGMLTAAEMRQLDSARGAAFDTLYLTGMIRHHEGALEMVAKLFATPGAAQQPDLSGFAADVDAGQRAEIARMQAMLNTLTTTPNR